MAIRFPALWKQSKAPISVRCWRSPRNRKSFLSQGLPAPATFPLKELTECAIKVREEDGAGAMQYGPSMGFMGLRQAIADRMNRMYGPMGMDKVDPQHVMITTGSQQGLDMVGRVFLDKDDVVLIESPSYLGAIGAFALNQPKFVEVPTDDQGMIPEELEKIITTTDRIKFIYVIPNYQNPTGICWSLERRKALMDLVTKYEIPVFEDNPYGDLRFEGDEIPPLVSMDPKHLVMYSVRSQDARSWHAPRMARCQ